MTVTAYLKWVWKRAPLWSKLYIANMILLLAAFFFPHPYNFAAFFVVLVNMCLFLLSMIRDDIITSYERFKEEQNKLVDILKNSEQK